MTKKKIPRQLMPGYFFFIDYRYQTGIISPEELLREPEQLPWP